MSLAKKILNEIGTKKILKFLLPHDDKYTISDYFVNPNEHSLCDNCKKRIVYAVEIKNAKGKQFKVGLDCAETLSSLDAIKLGQIRQNFKAIINIMKKLQPYMSKDISFIKKKNTGVLSAIYNYSEKLQLGLIDISRDQIYFNEYVLEHTTYFDKIKVIDNENEYLSFYKEKLAFFSKEGKTSEMKSLRYNSRYRGINEYFDTPKLDKIKAEEQEKNKKDVADKYQKGLEELRSKLDKEKFVVLYDYLHIKWNNDNYWYMTHQMFSDVLKEHHYRISYKELPTNILTGKQEKLMFHHNNKAGIKFIEGKEYEGKIYAVKDKNYLLFVPVKQNN